jgi:GntR family transcriptional regulator
MAQQDTSPIRLDPSTGVPFYRQIIDQVLLSVGHGKLKAGEQLPTVRQLAVDLAVNLNTVARAYREMEIRGIVETQQGTGTFIAFRQQSTRAGSSAASRKSMEELVDRCVAGAAAANISIEDLAAALIERAEKPNRRKS